MSARSLRVVLVDDHPVFRLGMRALLENIDDITLVDEAADGAAALDVVLAATPDVVLLDLNLPDCSGIEVARKLHTAAPQAALLVLTMVEDPAMLFAVLRAGARGYLVKGAGQDELVRSIRAVADGDLVVGKALAAAAAEGLLPRPQQPFRELTEREHEILDLVARGHDNATIAGRLHLSPKTVRNHVSNVMLKLGATSRADAVARARDAGLGTS